MASPVAGNGELNTTTKEYLLSAPMFVSVDTASTGSIQVQLQCGNGWSNDVVMTATSNASRVFSTDGNPIDIRFVVTGSVTYWVKA